ncbi:MAG TPA: metal ABC transporter permease [Acidimicrobiia bacterium]|nr:metal ABC transporter permease [Acidimicrobiia bacterium]
MNLALTLTLPWPFDRDYMQLALIAGLVVGACGPLIGAFLVEKRMALLGDGLGHLAFAGVAIGLLTDVWPIWTALIAAVAGAIVVEWLRSHGRASGDLALAMIFYGGIALAVVVASRTPEGSSVNIVPYLFGSILTVTASDVRVIVVLGVVIVATLLLAGRALFAIVLDEESARVAGLPVDALNTLLAALTAVTIVAAMRVVGVLLVAALMVLPVAASRLVARSFRGTLVGAVLVGIASVVGGLAAARQWDLAPGGSIVLTTVAIFAVTAVIGSVRGRSGALLRIDH